MASTNAMGKPFRFMDLPVELRCMIYDELDFEAVWYTPSTVQALIELNKRYLPESSEDHTYDKRVRMSRPQAPFEIMQTCRQVRNEALSILERRTKDYKSGPLKFLLDYSAVPALTTVIGGPRNWRGEPDGRVGIQNKTVRDFVELCRNYLTETRLPSINPLLSPQAIEVTIIHTNEVAYSMEALERAVWLGLFATHRPTRLVVTYKSPLPKIKLPDGELVWDASDLEEMLLKDVIKEIARTRSDLNCGVFVQPLEGEAFEKHMKSIEQY